MIEQPITNEDLKISDLPSGTASRRVLEQFALTFNAYIYWQGNQAKQEADDCDCLSHLRTKLFDNQRAGRHSSGIDVREAIKTIEEIRYRLEIDDRWSCLEPDSSRNQNEKTIQQLKPSSLHLKQLIEAAGITLGKFKVHFASGSPPFSPLDAYLLVVRE